MGRQYNSGTKVVIKIVLNVQDNYPQRWGRISPIFSTNVPNVWDNF